MSLDLDFVRAQFPAFELDEYRNQSFFENAGGSLACRHTIDALHRYYTETKVQPYSRYAPSVRAGHEMDATLARWATALGCEWGEVSFGPSTSMNTYVLAQAFAEILQPGDEVIVTNQDHEANTGVFRRMAERVGATVHEWRVDPSTGLLDQATFEALLSQRTRLVSLPHCSNVVGQENPVATWTALAHQVGARVICDGVSFAPHGLPDVAALGVDVYLFSLYKVYSVHQGLMVARNGIIDELPNQGHWFNADSPLKRLTPAGPDHAQIAAGGAVLDYLVDTHLAHGGDEGDDLRRVAGATATLWQAHEAALVTPVLDYLAGRDDLRLIGPAAVDAVSPDLHRCPTVAFVPRSKSAASVARDLVDHGVMCNNGNFYAVRLLEGLDVATDPGVVRLSWVHYTDSADIDRLLNALDEVL